MNRNFSIFAPQTAIARVALWLDNFLGMAQKRSISLIHNLQHRTEVVRLAELDAHALADLGLTRADVLGALEQPMKDDPSLYLVSLRDNTRRARGDMHREVMSQWTDPSVR